MPHLLTTVLYFSGRLQEVNSMINKRLKDVLFSDQWSERCMDTLSPFGYVLVSTQSKTYNFCICKVCLLCLYVIFHLSPPYRWRPSACRECCCWFSLNSAIFRSSEACRHRVLAQDLGDIGYVMHIEDCRYEINHVVKFDVGLCQWVYGSRVWC